MRAGGYIARNVFPQMVADPSTLFAYHDPDDVLLVFPQWGQSKTWGTNGGSDPLISTAALYSGLRPDAVASAPTSTGGASRAPLI